MRFLPGFYDVFDDMFDDGWMSPSTNAMQCDIKEVDNNYEMNIALPGYKKEETTGRIVRRERYSGNCSRSFYVGEEFTEEDIKAKFDNGELMISVPKEAPKRIEKKSITIY